MVRQKPTPNFLNSQSRLSQTWSLTGTELASVEDQVLKVVEHSRIIASEKPSHTTRKRKVTRREDDDSLVEKLDQSYLEDIGTRADVTLESLGIVKAYLMSQSQLKKSKKPFKKLRSRVIPLKTSNQEELRVMADALRDSKEHLILLLDLADDVYVLQTGTKTPEQLSKFSLGTDLYPNLEVLAAVSSLTKKQSVILTCDIGSEEERTSLEVSEWIDFSLAIDYSVRDSDRFFYDAAFFSNTRINKHLSLFLNSISCAENPSLVKGEDSVLMDPDDIQGILGLCEEESLCKCDFSRLQEQSEALLPKLRPYQRAAVDWMLFKETNPKHCFLNPIDVEVHPLFCQVLFDDLKIYLNAYTGQFSTRKPLLQPPMPGGVLADEMGLGKTLEVLDLVLKHPRELSGQCNEDLEDDVQLYRKRKVFAFGDSSDEEGFTPEFENVTVSCVCGVERFDADCDDDYDEDGLNRTEPAQCVKCSSWLHPSCVFGSKSKKRRKSCFVCPFCVVQKQDLMEVGATLIVSPGTISAQWLKEIDCHVREGALRVLHYTGVSSSHKFIDPSEFSQYDVVLTTFETLRSELLHTNLHDDNTESPSKRANVPKQKLLEAEPHPCRLRRAKRYRALPSPLPGVQWWRVCVDEAQMIECHTAQATEMLLRLNCVNRWCVTGTPIRRNIKDIYGLMLFLRVDPLYVKHWWTEFVAKPLKTVKGPSSVSFPGPDDLKKRVNESEAVISRSTHDGFRRLSVLLKALKFVMWRTSKEQVRDQICIPKQHVHTKSIQFSPIETHFYNRKKAKCAQRAKELTKGLLDENRLLCKVDREIAKKILLTVGDLRKTCIHPQMVRGWTIGQNSRLMTMQDLLADMKAKAVRECEETVRQICSSLNGIAGLKILQNQVEEAVDVYRSVLLRVSNYGLEGLRTDALPKIHSLYNLHRILSCPDYSSLNMPRTTGDTQLLQQCEQLKEEYLAVFDKDLRNSHSKLDKIVQQITEVQSKIDFNAWLAELSEVVFDKGCDKELIEKVYSDLAKNQKSVREDFRSLVGLEYYVYTNLEEVRRKRDQSCKSVELLNGVPDERTIAAAYHCHLKPEDVNAQSKWNSPSSKRPKKQKCRFCVVHDELVKYEKVLFDSSVNIMNLEDEDFEERTEQSWRSSRLELICVSISSYVSSNGFPPENQESARSVKTLFGLFREEFRALRDFWRCITNRVAGHDELRMATDRFRVQSHSEDNEEKLRNVIEPHMVPITLKMLQTELDTFENELIERKGMKNYLENLEQSKDLEGENKNGYAELQTEPCPVCKGPFGVQWSVFACGHSFCLRCLSLLLDDPNYSSIPSSSSDLTPLLMTSKKSQVKCPLCRKCCPVSAIGYVTTNQTATDSSTNENAGKSAQIHGDLSAKTHEIVLSIKSALEEDATAKFLIFSSWNEVLNILSSALDMNSVPHLAHKSGSAFQAVLRKFKRDSVYPVLLLPYKSSSSGLNIVEANHVVIVEPVLNPAAIHQAIGRVDRISQSRETHVHMFVIENSVEERLCELIPQFNLSSQKGLKLNMEVTPPISVQDVNKIFQ